MKIKKVVEVKLDQDELMFLMVAITGQIVNYHKDILLGNHAEVSKYAKNIGVDLRNKIEKLVKTFGGLNEK